MSKIPNKFRKLCGVYKHFGHDSLDYSDEAMARQMDLENGAEAEEGDDHNGYADGQKWSSLMLTMWREDIAKGLLIKFELYEDKAFSKIMWWLEPRVREMPPGTSALLGGRL